MKQESPFILVYKKHKVRWLKVYAMHVDVDMFCSIGEKIHGLSLVDEELIP